MRKAIFLAMAVLSACDVGPRNSKGDLLSGEIPYKDDVDFHNAAVRVVELCKPSTPPIPPAETANSITLKGKANLDGAPGVVVFVCRDCPQGRVGHAIDVECPARK